MTGAEFRCYRERLGLPVQWISDKFDVRERTIARWEYGHKEIPQPIADEIWRLLNEADKLVDKLVAQAGGGDLKTYRTDREYADDGGRMPASWHRAITARAAEEVEAKILYSIDTPDKA